MTMTVYAAEEQNLNQQLGMLACSYTNTQTKHLFILFTNILLLWEQNPVVIFAVALSVKSNKGIAISKHDLEVFSDGAPLVDVQHLSNEPLREVSQKNCDLSAYQNLHTPQPTRVSSRSHIRASQLVRILPVVQMYTKATLARSISFYGTTTSYDVVMHVPVMYGKLVQANVWRKQAKIFPTSPEGAGPRDRKVLMPPSGRAHQFFQSARTI